MTTNETEAKVREQYLKAGYDPKIPIIWASSPPVGAFLAPILAHEFKINSKVIKKAISHATQLALGKPNGSLVAQYRDVLSHELKSGAGAYCSQPGGAVWKKIGSPQFSHNAMLANIKMARNEDVRNRIHDYYKRRVKYHGDVAFLDTSSSWLNKRFVVLVGEPDHIENNDLGRVSSTTKPAISYKDGWAIYMVNGVRIPSHFIEDPDSLTVENISKVGRNAEIARVLIELMGYEKWLSQSGAKLVHNDVDQDGRPRKLWDTVERGVGILEVFNSSPEPDGTFKKYFLRVPSNIPTVENALTWMIDDNPDAEFEMGIET